MHPTAVERNFRVRATRQLGWGAVLLALAAVSWIYSAWTVFTPYTLESWHVDCPAPAFSDRSGIYSPDFQQTAEERHCAGARDWPGPVSALVVSTPLATVGAVLFTSGSVTRRTIDHETQLRRAREDEEKRRSGS
ncbi:hypothetical protein [Streptomyces winkii]|uniref:hypothetical protein n=1 Tax=Streptomyces winkii TaxID=3051178 RepID=UPI0028D2B2B9|nr:hypothetical protein [Streptomyces sp. DSM 40971]